jgi:NAD(P)-dependent dehydrogenase (short-subunit alcohol dehydrogenase family)
VPDDARSGLLRPALLDAVDVVLAGEAGPVGETCAALGARVHRLAPAADDEAAQAAAAALPAAEVLVCATAALLREQGPGAAVEAAWVATRAVVTERMAPAGLGLVILLAPRPADGPAAGQVAAALANLAQTTAVEWARLGVRVVSVRPADATPDAALGELVAYLASPAGAYFSACTLELGTAGLSGYTSGSS